MLPSDSVNEEMIYTMCQIKFQPLRKQSQACLITRIGISWRCSKCTRKNWANFLVGAKKQNLNPKGWSEGYKKTIVLVPKVCQVGSGSLSTKNMFNWLTDSMICQCCFSLAVSGNIFGGRDIGRNSQRHISSPLLERKMKNALWEVTSCPYRSLGGPILMCHWKKKSQKHPKNPLIQSRAQILQNQD